MWNHVVPVVLSYSSNKFKIFYKNYAKMLLLTNLEFCLSDPAFIVDCLVKITPDYCFYECIERFIFETFAEQGNTFSNDHYRYIKFRLTSIYEFWYAYKLFLLIRYYYLFVSGCRLTSCNIRIYFGCALAGRCKTDIFVLVFLTK